MNGGNFLSNYTTACACGLVLASCLAPRERVRLTFNDRPYPCRCELPAQGPARLPKQGHFSLCYQHPGSSTSQPNATCAQNKLSYLTEC